MRFYQLTAVLAAITAPVFAQNPLQDLPPDLASYVASVETDPAVIQAVEQLAAATGVAELLSGVINGNGSPLDANSFVSSLEAAANAAISAEPSDVRAIAMSVIGVVESLASSDNLAATLANEFSLTAAPTTAATTLASSSASTPAAQTTASVTVNTPNAAVQPTGMALGAFVGAVAVVAAVL